MKRKKVVIIGGGFGGIHAAKTLRKSVAEITLIDKTNYHLFQPLLYQVATGALSASNIAIPIREILRNQENTSVIMNDVVAIDKQHQEIKLFDGGSINYDYLIVATGAITAFFGHDEWQSHALGLKTLTDAAKVSEHILLSFELAEQCDSKEEAKKYLRFVLIGGGPTGVEMAGAIAEIALGTMIENFKKITPKETEIILIEGADQILPSYPLKLSIKAKEDLEGMGVKVFTNAFATNITNDGIYLRDQFIPTKNVLWTAGNTASPLLKTLNVPLTRDGRAIVEQDLTISGYPNLFVIGDAAAFSDPVNGILPGLAPVAMQQGNYVGKIILRDISQEMRKPFKYHDKGSMATIGTAKAVAKVGNFCFSGVLAWLAWSFIHIAYLISFRNRFLVMAQWIFLYLTNVRNALIIPRSIDEIKEADFPSNNLK